MPELNFHVDAADVVPYAASPHLALKLRVVQAPSAREALVAIHSVALRCQIRLEPGRRRYSPAEQGRLVELFGEPRRWGQTVRSSLWAHTTLTLPPFIEQVSVDMPIPCTFDFNIATTKYFHALEDGDVPICLLFSGTIFYARDDGALQIAQISWEKETEYRLPVSVWKRMMDQYYPNVAWLCLSRDAFDKLQRFKAQRGLPTWEQTIDAFLDEQEEAVPS